MNQDSAAGHAVRRESSGAMNERTALSHDGFTLKYAYVDHARGRPWIVLIIPFGLKVDIARAFFDFLDADYNIITWEARLILSPPEQQIGAGDLSVENHVADLLTVLDSCHAGKAKLVGYCSGAGIALAAINAAPDRFEELVLINGEYTLLKDSSCVTQFGSDIDSLLPMASKDRKMAQFILDRMQFDKKPHTTRSLPEGIHLPFSKVHYFHRYAVNYSTYRTMDFEKLARTVSNNTLLITGKCDLQTNISSSEKIKKSILRSAIVIDPEGDHYEVLRPNSRTLATVRDFFEGERSHAR